MQNAYAQHLKNFHNVTPLPKNPKAIQKIKEKKTPHQQQQFSYIKMTLAVVVGNGVVLAGLFGMFLLYLSTVTPFVD